MVLVRDASYPEDTDKLITDVTSFRWGYKGKFVLKEDSDPEYILEVVRASYNSTL